VVDELAVPDRLEDAVGEPQGDMFCTVLAKVVIDAEDLSSTKYWDSWALIALMPLAVVTEWLLDDQPRPPGRQEIPPAADLPTSTGMTLGGTEK
jgi:hypothetical protein